MDEYLMSVIHKEAERIREEINGGFIFGLPIDMNNPDMVLCASYTLAINKQRAIAAKELERTLGLFA